MKNQLALVFDFDDTLAHDSTTDLLASFGVNVKTFWEEENRQLIDQGWDPVPSFLFQMYRWSRMQAPENCISKDKIEAFGSKVRFFEGVEEFFPHLKNYVKKINKNISLEFYIISSGLGDLIRKTSIAPWFKDIFASDFEYNSQGNILFPKRVVSFTDKTRYLFQISKGLVGPEYKSKPFEVNNRSKEIRIPFTQMIYIGDGLTDVPCFSLLNKAQGISMAVYDQTQAVKKHKAWGLIQDGRVKTLYSVNYRPGSDLVNALEMALESIIQTQGLK